jgi:uncharacterized membrane protein
MRRALSVWGVRVLAAAGLVVLAPVVVAWWIVVAIGAGFYLAGACVGMLIIDLLDGRRR